MPKRFKGRIIKKWFFYYENKNFENLKIVQFGFWQHELIMREKFTIFVAGNAGRPVRQFTVSGVGTVMLALVGFLCFCAAGYVAYDYCWLKHNVQEVEKLNRRLASQKKHLSAQRNQLESLAEQLNHIKSRLAGLNEFEKKIRVIANVEVPAGTQGLFGVGGVPPGRIEPSLEKERPNAFLREMHDQLNLLDAAFASQQENMQSLLTYLEDKRRLLASTPAIRPVNGGWVTSRFAYRKSPFTGKREFHHGLDIAARVRTPVMAAADGEVIFSGYKGSLGNTIIIDHGYGLVTRYGHLHKCLKKHGASVDREEVIGQVGNSGLSTGPHVHYEVRVNGVPVNPEKYILN